jgi:hypothetical protein
MTQATFPAASQPKAMDRMNRIFQGLQDREQRWMAAHNPLIPAHPDNPAEVLPGITRLRVSAPTLDELTQGSAP